MKKHYRKNKVSSLKLAGEIESVVTTWHLRIVAVLTCLGFLVYLNAMTASFQWDDFAVIVNNPAIRNVWDFRALFDAFNTRFLVGWTFAANYSFSQLNIVGYHFVNIWFHVCNAVLVYAFGYQIFSRLAQDGDARPSNVIQKSFGASLIFLLHPLATQPVNYIWQRSTLMMTFFFLATVVMFLEYRRTSVKGMLGGALVTCFLAMFTKETAFVLPVAIIAVDQLWTQSHSPGRKSRPWILYACFLVTMAVIPLLLTRAEHLSLKTMVPYSATRGVAEDVISRNDYVLTQINVWMTYLRLFVFPVGQNVDHDYPLVAQAGWLSWWAAFIFHAGILGTAFYYSQRYRLLTLAVVWFYLNLSLESFITSPDLCVEHRMYLPMVGLCFFVSHMIVIIFAKRDWRPAAIILGIMAVLLGVATVCRNAIWQDPFSLWNDAVLKSPMKARPLNNRGQILRQVGQSDLALADYNHAIALDTSFAAAYQNRGNLLKLKGDINGALNDYSTVIHLEPDNAQAYASRGNIYKRKKEWDLALNDYTAAAERESSDPEIFANRGYLKAMLKQYDQALADYERALKINPQYVYALNNRGNLNVQLRNYQAALGDYSKAIMVQPDFAEAYANRAVAYFHLDMIGESKADVLRAQQLGQTINSNFIKELNNK
ncbi:MAG: tetratricopeptide repeat protein [Candidatus Omnitrophica bacterium]|nr:tetratricopeptide repeat protein [Candidatus Omnitrophota bacterium]